MFGFGKKREDDGKSLTQPLPEGWQVVDLGLLGSGGMARVYRVRDEVLGREVALKVLRPELMKEDAALASFVTEARITAQLDHPNIPAVYALGSERKRSSVFTMKVLEGQTLQQVLEQDEIEGRGLPEALEVLLRICDALAFAHSRGVLHLDLKPSNVIVADFGQIYLVDWGIARRKSELPKSPIEVRTAQGTPNYMAPEQAKGELWNFDERTDIFALGGMLYRVLCGKAPHASSTTDQAMEKAVAGVVTPPDVVAAGRKRAPVPRRLVAICMKALAKDPGERYQTVEAFQRDLERYARGLAQLPRRGFKAGEPIITEGEPGDAAYVIIEGSCVASRLVGGQPQELRRLAPGELFGEAAVFTGQPRSATVTAVTDTVVGIVDQAALREEMDRTSFMSLAIRTVASTFLDLDRQLIRQRQQGQVIEQALREFVVTGTRGTPWKPLLQKLVERSGESEEDVSAWVLGAPGFALEGESLVVH